MNQIIANSVSKYSKKLFSDKIPTRGSDYPQQNTRKK
jgi:hypothetical protein